MKTIKLIFFLLLLTTLGINAQTPVCQVNATNWKRITTINIDYECIKPCIQMQVECRRIYNTNSEFVISIYKCLQNNKMNCKHKDYFKNYDLTKYELFIVAYGKGSACDMSMNYILYNDGNERPVLLVNVLIPEVRCKAIKSLVECFLVLKKDCPIRPKVCLLQHLIALRQDND